MKRMRGQVGRFWAGGAGRAVAATAAIALLAGCSDADGSDGSDGGGRDPAGELVDRLPEDALVLASVDIVAVRRALGLPDDEGIDDLSDDSVRQLAFALGEAVPFVSNPRDTPIRDAFDTGAMTAVASVPYAIAPERAAVVVRTTQPFDELAAALEDRGYERDGDLLVTDGLVSEMGGVTVVTAAGEDLIVLAQSAEVARAVAAGEGDGPALAEALDAVDGPVRIASATSADLDSCVETLAAGSQVDPTEGAIVVTVAEPDDADGLELLPGDSPVAGSVDLDPLQVDGRSVTTRYRYHRDDGFGSPLAFLTAATSEGDGFYRCP